VNRGAACKIRTCDPRIHHTTTFVAIPHMGNVRALDFLFIIPTLKVGLDAHRQVSTPSPFGAWLGIAI